jgi:acetyl esterase/lipase
VHGQPPRRMTADDLHPDLRRVYRFIPNMPIAHAWQRALIRGLMSLAPAPRSTARVMYERVDLGPGARIHLFSPAGQSTGAALLWIHGGGMVIGAAAQDHRRNVALAEELGIAVASIDYRLAPEHPFPQPLEDCHRAWKWLQAEAPRYGIDAERIAIGGQSAGGGLAAGLVQRLADEGGVPPAAQWLFCPMLDDRTAADRDLDAVRHAVWDNRANRVGWRAYLGVEPGGESVPPYAVPARRTDLAGLPPTWIGTGTAELFNAEDIAYARALQAAGVDCTLDNVAGAPHGFESAGPGLPLARAYLQRAQEWLQSRIAPPDEEER